VHRADNLTTFKCRLSRNLGASTSWNPKDLSRPVMGLLYLFTSRPQSSWQWHTQSSFDWLATFPWVTWLLSFHHHSVHDQLLISSFLYFTTEAVNKYTYKFQQWVEMTAQWNCIWDVVTFRTILHEDNNRHSSYTAVNIWVIMWKCVTSNYILSHCLHMKELNTFLITPLCL
jgi:hypothetical protein